MAAVSCLVILLRFGHLLLQPPPARRITFSYDFALARAQAFRVTIGQVFRSIGYDCGEFGVEDD